MQFVWKCTLCRFLAVIRNAPGARRTARGACLLLWFIFAAVGTAQGAVFVLATGGQIEGQLLNPNEKPRQSYVVRTEAGGTVKLAVA